MTLWKPPERNCVLVRVLCVGIIAFESFVLCYCEIPRNCQNNPTILESTIEEVFVVENHKKFRVIATTTYLDLDNNKSLVEN